jgi:uncharacterized protein (TIGR02145 family)
MKLHIKSVILSGTKWSRWISFLLFFAFIACTDYVQQIDERYGEWGSSLSSETVKSSSSSVTPQSSNSETSVSTGSMTDSRDGQTYKTVKIGEQIWMAENLNYEVEGQSFCIDNSPENCAKYGRFYTWAAAVGKTEDECGNGKTCELPDTVRGVCPEGWHLPSKAEWETLFNAVGGQSTAGKELKSTSGWSSGGNGTDAFWFSALPAGNGYYLEGSNAFFWSSTEDPSNYACGMDLCNNDDNAGLGYYHKGYDFSVRCLKD